MQPCAIPTPIGVLLPIATATTPFDSAPVGEPGAPDAARRAAREWNRRAGDRVRTRDDVGLVARLRVHEQEHDRVRRVGDRDHGLRGRLLPGRARVATLRRPESRVQRGRECDRRAAGVDQALRPDGRRSGHARDGGAACGLLCLGCDGVEIGVAGREDENEPRLMPELSDRTLDGIGRSASTGSGRRAGHTFADVGSGCWGHAAGVESRGCDSYRHFRADRKHRAACAVTSMCGRPASS